MNNEIKEKIEKLKSSIKSYDRFYYTLNFPEISDEEYDKLMIELIELENKFPEFKTLDSPTQKVGGEISKKFPTFKHEVQMLSLQNTYDENEVKEFDNRIKNFLNDEKYNYICEFKYDGIALSLHYENGILQNAVTRGDGVFGDDITKNVKTIRSIPFFVNGKKKIEVRGEAFMLKNDFQKLNEERKKNEKKIFMNPRNSTAGSLKLQDSKIVAKRKIRFFSYSLFGEISKKTQFENLELLNELKFPVNPNFKVCNTIDEVINFWKEVLSKRQSLQYEIDGIVVKVNSVFQQQKIGTISKSPRWAIAYKFPSNKVETILKNIRLQVGRIGTITPVAELEPILIAGTVVKNASLYNEDYIKKLDIRIGDCVIVEKGGDVIPKVSSVVIEKRSKKTIEFYFPKNCPECNFPLTKNLDEANYYCENLSCSAQIQNSIEHFVSRNAMNIEGFGEAIIETFLQKKIIENIADIYELKNKKNILVDLENFGEKSIRNLLNAIEKSKEKPFEKVLFAIGIRHIGETVAKKLIDKFSNIDELKNAKLDELIAVKNIGEKIAQSIIIFFSNKENVKLVERLKNLGLNFCAQNNVEKNIFNNKTFVLTGTLQTLKREDAKNMIEKFGGKVLNSISKNVDYVLVGEDAGSKLEKAKELNLKIIYEIDFFEMTQNG